MKRRKLFLALAMAAAAAMTGAPVGAGHNPREIDAGAAFAQLKQLVGVWETQAAGGKTARTEFELTANGTVLLERYANEAMPGGGRMATAYHLDGKALVLTHYCIANNQPVLRAERFDPATREIQFEFLRAGNLPSPAAGHMHRARYRIVDANHFDTEWEFFENGAKKMAEIESFTRVR